MSKLTLLLVAIATFSCSSSTSNTPRARAPWVPDLAQFFDDAADFIENPGDLQGDWATSYQADLRGLVDEADLICRIHVTTINEDIAIDGHRRKHLLTRITSTLRGTAPAEDQLDLNVDEGSAGFDSVDRSERRLFNGRYVAFVRWYEDENGQLQSHWHLSPGTNAVVEMVRQAITERENAPPRRDREQASVEK
jgi:hypothetical protein